MKENCIQTMLIDSNKAYLLKWKSIALKQIGLIEPNESQVHSNKANSFK